MTTKQVLENQYQILHSVKQASEQPTESQKFDPSSLSVMLKSLNLAEFLTSHNVQLGHNGQGVEPAKANGRSLSDQEDEKQRTIPRTH